MDQNFKTDIKSFPWRKTNDNQFQIQSQVKGWWQKTKHSAIKKRKENKFLDYAQLILPCIGWLRQYDVKGMLMGDLIAGMSVGLMVIPQAVSYAQLAGLPAQFGLFGACAPVFVYALFGSSRQLAVGPVAVTSLILSNGLGKLVEGVSKIKDPNNVSPKYQEFQDNYNLKAIQVAFLVACLYTSVGILRLGFLSKFLSHSVISGFTTGAALTIGFSQVKYVTGIHPENKGKVVYKMISGYITSIKQFQWQEFLMGGLLLLLLLAMKELSKRNKKLAWLRPLGPLTAMVIGIIVIVSGSIQKMDDPPIAVVGNVPSGPPKLTVNKWLPLKDVQELLVLAVQIMLVSFLESQSIATALALKNGYEISTNREIIGMGLANFAGAAFNAYSTTGSFSRSAVANDTGAKSGLAGFTTFIIVLLTVSFATPIFKVVPKNVLGAIVISSVIGLLDFGEALFLLKVNKKDFAVWLASFLGSIFLGVEIGLAIAICLALLIVLAETAFPHTAELGRLPNSEVYRNVKQYPEAMTHGKVVMVRFDAALYFANSQVFKQVIAKYVARGRTRAAEADRPPPIYCAVDMSPIGHLDAAGLHAIDEIITRLKGQGMTLLAVNPNAKVVHQLQTANMHKKIGMENFFVKMHDAIRYVELTEQTQLARRDSDELQQLNQGFQLVRQRAELAKERGHSQSLDISGVEDVTMNPDPLSPKQSTTKALAAYGDEELERSSSAGPSSGRDSDYV